MCGIAGTISKESNLHDLGLMLAMIMHRGPDEFGIYMDDQAALGSARLSIIDPQNGKQPVYDEDRKVALIFNGEIYNHDELREQLKKKGRAFRTKSDSEVLLKVYLEYGEDFLSFLNGQFAISIWDQRTETLILARDRVGIRPLFYYERKDFFIFASEIKALLTHKKVPKEFNAAALDQIYTFWTAIGSHTLFKNIKELLPGHKLVLNNGEAKLSPYWTWPFPSLTEGSASSFQEEQERFSEKLQSAVDLRLKADVEVGAYLSGGIDSSAIVALASQSRLEGIRTYSIAFKEKSYDERDAQDIVSKLFKTDHHMIDCDYKDIESNFRNIIWHTEAPIFRTAQSPLYMLSQAVHEDGLKVVLTGEGSDEILLGYDLFQELRIRKFWARRPDSEMRPQLFKRLYAYLPHYSNPRFANLTIQSFKAHLTEDSPFYSHLVRWNNCAANKTYFSDQLQTDLSNYDCLEEMSSLLPQDYFKVDDMDRAQYLEMTTLLRGYLLASQGDRMSMAHSIEGRYPFLDHEFIAYANSLPKRFKFSGLNGKSILRKSMKAFLPQEICARPKVAYQAPEIRPFIKLDKTMSPLLNQYVCREQIERVGLFRWELVERLIKKIQQSDLTRLGTRDSMAFVQILSTQIFYNLFFGKDLQEIAEENLKNKEKPFFVRFDKRMQGADITNPVL